MSLSCFQSGAGLGQGRGDSFCSLSSFDLSLSVVPSEGCGQTREGLDLTWMFTGPLWLPVGKRGRREQAAVVRMRLRWSTLRQGVGGMGSGWGHGGRGKWIDSVYTVKMEVTEFPEELDVGCENKEE